MYHDRGKKLSLQGEKQEEGRMLKVWRLHYCHSTYCTLGLLCHELVVVLLLVKPLN